MAQPMLAVNALEQANNGVALAGAAARQEQHHQADEAEDDALNLAQPYVSVWS